MNNLKSIIRRLTPVECSRLMGFNGDSYLDADGALTKDSPRYKACGNSWAVNSAEFVNYRIERVLRELGYVSDGRAIQYATTCSGVEAHSQAVKDCAWNANFFSEIEKFPCRVLAARYPHVPNLGDMTKVDGAKYDLDVFSGGTPCFTAGNMVLTEHGYRPIEEINVGDLVVSHKGRLCKVTAVGSKLAHNVVNVSCKTTRPIRCTDDHKFWTPVNPRQDFRRKSDKYLKIIFDGMEFKPIRDIGPHGFVSKMRDFQRVEHPSFPSVYSAGERDIVELAGWYVGDGHCAGFSKNTHKKCLVLSLNKDKVEKFKSRFDGVIKFSVHLHDKNGVFRVQVSCTDLCNWLVSNFGHKSHAKTIPAWVICGSDELKSSFLDGYMATDGFSNDEYEFACSTTSLSLAMGLADMVGLCFVYKSNVPVLKEMYDGRIVNQRPFYNVRRAKMQRVHHEYEKWDIVRVRGIEKAEDEIVYNITVEEDHGYIVNGICVSNCQSVSVAGKRHGMAEDSGTRSSLAYHWLRIGREANAKILLWENVCGALSSNGGRDFAWFVYRIQSEGYAVAWRVMDVQYNFTMNFPRAIPQRRRRIWLVASADGDWRTPARILFERSSRLGDEAPMRVLNDGTVVDAAKAKRVVCDDLFSWAQSGPRFSRASRADMIPLDAMPEAFGGAAANWLRECGDVRYYGGIFADGSLGFTPDNLEPKLLKAIGAGAGVAVGGRIASLKTREWNAGIQLPWGVAEVPREFDGTVCGLSDILLPWGDHLGKYLLSKRACEGIVRRAEKRGKELPQVLKDALAEQIGNWDNHALDRYLVKEGLVGKDEVDAEDAEEEGGCDGDGGEDC